MFKQTGRWLTVFMLMLMQAAAGKESVFAENGKTDFVIIVSGQIQKSMAEDVAEFIRCLKVATGADFVTADAAAGKKTVSLRIDPEREGDPEAFSFIFPDENTIIISGGSQHGLRFALTDFLERYVNCRWLFPGELGEVIPKVNKLVVPRKAVSEKPHFLSRHAGAGAFTPQSIPFYKWSRGKLKANNYRRMHGENMFQVVPVKIYGKSNPEFYPLFNGKRYIPGEKEHSFWQPCYSEPTLVPVAVERISQSLSKQNKSPENLRLFSYSVGINDSNGFCECARCLAMDKNSPKSPLGSVSRSPAYLNFINQVAAGVVREHPQAQLGFIAYAGVTAPPVDMKLHPALQPHICVELFQWADPQRRKVIQKLYSDWRKAGIEVMGSYDYSWGRGYMLPRVYNRTFADALKWLYENGVRHYRSEFKPFPDWYEGPKAYIMLKLLWNPYCDVEALENEWYELAAGQKAAPYLKEYFKNLEVFWTTRAVKSSWFEKSPATYLKAGNVSYLEFYPESELVKSRKLLEKAYSLAETPQQRARIKLYLDAVKKYTPTVQQFHKNLALQKKFQQLKFDHTEVDYTFDTKPTMLTSWKRSKTRVEFANSPDGGIDHTAALMIDLTSSKRAPGSFVLYRKYNGKRAWKATVWARSDGNLKGDKARISISIQWRDGKRKIINAALNTSTKHSLPHSGEWRELVVYGVAPSDSGIISVSLTASHSDGGKVYFDNLKLESAALE